MADIPLETLDRDALRRLVAAEVAKEQRQSVTKHSEPMLLWLALVPAWPASFIEAKFPTVTGFVTGSDALRAVQAAVDDGLAMTEESEVAPHERIFWMSKVQADSILRHVASLESGRERILLQMQFAAAALRDVSRIAPLPDDLERWRLLVGTHDTEDGMADVLDVKVRDAIDAATRAKSGSCAEARRWIETAEPIAEWLGGSLYAALVRANRRFELFHRRAADQRRLQNFLPLPRLVHAFEQLTGTDDDRWALHYVGGGGAGKTMLVCHITTELARDFAVARIDFDHLNPDYPTRAPALLLDAFATELRLYEPPDSRAFEFFDGEVRRLHKTAEAAASGLESGPSQFDRVLRAFVGAVQKLQKRPLLILDTCEELAKLRPDGQLPENVRRTFEILEEIHDQISGLRVIFSGRRALASRGDDWAFGDARLPARPYLRLQVVSGFTHEDALTYLGRYRDKSDRGVDREHYETILARSAATTHFASTNDSAPRYNPYDVAMYASLASAGELSDGAGEHEYVRRRIVERISKPLMPVLPMLAILGTFDRSVVRELLDGKQDSDAILNEIADLEWLSRVHAPDDEPFWTIDPILRERLLAYYQSESSSLVGEARRKLTSLLPRLTLERPWRALSVDYFAATFRVLERDTSGALEWWQRVEERITKDAEWSWAAQMTASVGGSDDDGNPRLRNPLLRAAALATHAASSARAGVADPPWREVITVLHGEADKRASPLRLRAHAGILYQLQWSAEPLERVTELFVAQCERVQPHSPVDASAIDLALLEGAVELIERIRSEPRIEEPRLAAITSRFLLFGSELLSFLHTSPLQAFVQSLLARLEALDGEIALARTMFEKSLALANDLPRLGPFLDWEPPAQPRVRLRLEAVRVLMRFDRNDALVQGVVAPGRSLDEDRLAAALAIAARDRGETLKIHEASATELPATCNAHRLVPSYLSVAIEALERRNFDDAWKLCNESLERAVRSGDVLLQQDLARTHLHLVNGHRLFEIGEKPSPLLLESQSANDEELLALYDALTGQEHVATTSMRWAQYKKSRRGIMPRLAAKPIPIDASSSFVDVWLGLDMFDDATAATREWLLRRSMPADDAMRIVIRLAHEGDSPNDTFVGMLAPIVQRLGNRRAAELLIEECELAFLAGRMKNMSMVLSARELFDDLGDDFGKLRTEFLLAIAEPKQTSLRKLLLRVRPERGVTREAVMMAVRSPRRADELLRRVEHAPWTLRLVAAALLADREHASAMKRNIAATLERRSVAISGRDLQKLAHRRVESGAGSPLADLVGEVLGVGLLSTVLSGVAWLLWKPSAWLADRPELLLATIVAVAIIVTVIAVAQRSFTAIVAVVTVLVLCAAWLGIYYGALWIVGKLAIPIDLGPPSSFKSIWNIDVWLAIGIYAAAQSRRTSSIREFVRELFAIGVRVDVTVSSVTLHPINVLARPTSHVMKLDNDVYPRTPYVSLRSHADDDSIALVDRWRANSMRRFSGQLVLSSDTADDLCWEALIDASRFSDDRVRAMPVWRTTSTTRVRTHERKRPTRIIIAADRRMASEERTRASSPGWRMQFHPLRFGGGPAVLDGEVVHLIGVPQEMRGDYVHLVVDQQSGTAIGPRFVDDSPSVVCCIVQGTGWSPLRTDSDREAAGLLRRFAGQVSRRGVPLVIVIPPLPSNVESAVIARITRDLTSGALRNPRSVCETLEDVRQLIRDFELDQDAAIELAYDVCCYIHHVPDLRPLPGKEKS